jgi:hypothetical protein
MNKPDFSLENWQRQRINEYIFVRSEQAAFDQITHDIQTDVELLVAGLAIGMMIEDDRPSVLTYFHEELGIPVAWLSACTNYMESCFKDGGKLKFGPECAHRRESGLILPV